MHIVGGVYRELCTIPNWDSLFGSGGRAAVAISSFSRESTLHTYIEETANGASEHLDQLGITVKYHSRSTNIVVAYFHPLSTPYIQPQNIDQQQPIHVSGEAVLRFGFIEGDAIVEADRAVYDPQTWRTKPSFRANGSKANELAIVLNEIELNSGNINKNLEAAAFLLMEKEQASVIVVKRGVMGATVFENDRTPIHIPCYRSQIVFKIGTGDIFSAIFSYYWAEKKLPVPQAADLASKSVAAYCDNKGQLPLDVNAIDNRVAWGFKSKGVVQLDGAVQTIGQRYTMEEARFALTELGVEVTCAVLGHYSEKNPTAALIVADVIDTVTLDLIEIALKKVRCLVVLCQDSSLIKSIKEIERIKIVNDFSTALYFVAWFSSEP
jgi:hypothetical protein